MNTSFYLSILAFSYAVLMSGVWQGSSRLQSVLHKAYSRIGPGQVGPHPALPGLACLG